MHERPGLALLGRLAARGGEGAGGGGVAGLVVYLQQEGRGVGLAMKVAAYALQEPAGAAGGLDTVDANRALGLPDDAREYRAVVDILGNLGLHDGGSGGDAGAGTDAGAGAGDCAYCC